MRGFPKGTTPFYKTQKPKEKEKRAENERVTNSNGDDTWHRQGMAQELRITHSILRSREFDENPKSWTRLCSLSRRVFASIVGAFHRHGTLQNSRKAAWRLDWQFCAQMSEGKGRVTGSWKHAVRPSFPRTSRERLERKSERRPCCSF